MMFLRVALASKSTLDLLAGKADIRQEKRQGCGLSQSQLHVSAVPLQELDYTLADSYRALRLLHSFFSLSISFLRRFSSSLAAPASTCAATSLV